MRHSADFYAQLFQRAKITDIRSRPSFLRFLDESLGRNNISSAGFGIEHLVLTDHAVSASESQALGQLWGAYRSSESGQIMPQLPDALEANGYTIWGRPGLIQTKHNPARITSPSVKSLETSTRVFDCTGGISGLMSKIKRARSDAYGRLTLRSKRLPTIRIIIHKRNLYIS